MPPSRRSFNHPGQTTPAQTFFTVYHRESEEFDRDYARKYDEDLNTSLIFVSCCRSFLACLLNPEIPRLVSSQQLVQRSSLMSSPSWNQIRTR